MISPIGNRQDIVLALSLMEKWDVKIPAYKNYNYLFFGSARFSAIFLQTLSQIYFLPKIVVCNPDKPIGRKKIVTPPQIKLIAQEKNIDVFQPKNKKGLSNISKLYQKSGAPELNVVAAYSKILPQAILDLPLHGTWGVHPSLLPKYRGATPIQSALLSGDQKTGVTIYQMDEKVDHGPILYQMPVEILPTDNYLSLEKKLAIHSAVAFIKAAWIFIEKNKAGTPQEQAHESATFTKKFTTAEGEVDMANTPPLEIYRKIQALNPEPGVFTLNYPKREGQRVKLLETKMNNEKVVITSIQPAGKKPFSVNFEL